MTHRAYFSVLAIALFAVQPAHADIGGIGSPVVPSNAPKAEPAASQPAAKPVMEKSIQPAETPQEMAGRKPLVVIRFPNGQKFVHYERALRRAVDATEKTKAGVVYYVVSSVPSSNNKASNQRMSDRAQENLRSVLDTLGKLGVESHRISYTSRAASASYKDGQQIDIFVE